MKDGILPVNKFVGITSYDVIRRFKRESGYKGKIGHAGTLDPFADGVLLLLLGKATKRFDEIQKWKKAYRATTKLGAKSRTLDSEGEIKEQVNPPRPSLGEVKRACGGFVGEIEQEVPAYSASKYKGKAMYKYARKGEKVPRKAKKVTVYSIEVVMYEYRTAVVDIECSSGTYIRQLSWDIFRVLGVDSYLKHLRRTRIGEVGLQECCVEDDFNDKKWEQYLRIK